MSDKKEATSGPDEDSGSTTKIGNPFAVGGPTLSPFAASANDDLEDLGPEKGIGTSRLLKSGVPGSLPFATDGDSPPSQMERPAASMEKDSPKPLGGGLPFSTEVVPEKKWSAPFSVPEEPSPPGSSSSSSSPSSPPASLPPRSRLGGGIGSIPQLELRAIFGVDRELSEAEILQRARSLKGIRQVARLSDTDIGAVEEITRLVEGLGFGDEPVTIYCGNTPIEFIQEGDGLIAVQNDGSFAPGVRETLMIVARELGKM